MVPKVGCATTTRSAEERTDHYLSETQMVLVVIRLPQVESKKIKIKSSKNVVQCLYWLLSEIRIKYFVYTTLIRSTLTGCQMMSHPALMGQEVGQCGQSWCLKKDDGSFPGSFSTSGVVWSMREKKTKQKNKTRASKI